MIAYLKGTVVSKEEDSLILEAGGVGYEAFMAPHAMHRIQEGQNLEVFVCESSALYGGTTTLYGFLSREEKEIFLSLKEHVPSTGAKKALEYLDKASRSLPDFRRAILAQFDLVSETLHAAGQLRLINSRRILLGSVEFFRLKCACPAVFCLRNIEDDAVRMQLGGCVPIHWPCTVMLEFRDDPFTCCFRRMISSHSGLGVPLHFVQCHSHTLPMRIPHTFVTTNKRRNRNAFWRAESCIPAGSVLHCLDCFAVFIDIFQWDPVLNNLLAR